MAAPADLEPPNGLGFGIGLGIGLGLGWGLGRRALVAIDDARSA